MFIKLKIIGTDGTLWVVPAELVQTKFSKRHRFAVHKSLSLEDGLWAVTHESTGATLGLKPTKQEAIDGAIAALKNLTVKQFEEKVEQMTAQMPKLTVGEYLRSA